MVNIGYAKVDLTEVKEWIKADEKASSSWYRKCQEEDSKNGGGDNAIYNLTASRNGKINIIRGEFVELAECVIADGQRFNLLYLDERYAILSYNDMKFIMPASLVHDVEMLKDYSYLTSDEIAALTDSEMSSAMVPAEMGATTVKTLREQLAEEEEKIKAEQEKYRLAVEEIMAAAKAKEAELKEILAKEKAKLDAVKQELETKLFVLETQIYGIRCYFGEVVDFTRIRSGKPAAEDEPVVMFQKIRFLDEEMGKYLSLFSFGKFNSDKETFIGALKARDDIRDVFCPSERCIAILKNSRTGKAVKVSSEIANMLEKYDYAHGKQIAILVRDGDNLYVGWTDEDKVTLSTEDMFLKPNQTTVSDMDETYRSELELKQKQEQDRSDRISRYFLLSVIQGMIDRGGLLNIPSKTKITEESDLVKFSFAEGWLQDTSYGTFEDILKESKAAAIKQGEMIYTVARPSRDDFYSYGRNSTRYDAYNNERGIGDRNRTHDASVPYQTLMPINKVLKECKVTATIKLMKPVFDRFAHSWWSGSKIVAVKPGTEVMQTVTKVFVLDEDDFNKAETLTNIAKVIKRKEHYNRETKPEDIMFKIDDGGYIRARDNLARYDSRIEGEETVSDDTCQALFDGYGFPEITIDKVEDEKLYTYVSVKADSYGWTESRVNFKIYPDEYIRASYLCSTWIKYVITTRNVGERIGSTRLDYAQVLPYLKAMLDFTTQQEAKDKELLIAAGGENWINNNPKWDLEVCKWRIANSIPTLTAASAKKFLKTVKLS